MRCEVSLLLQIICVIQSETIAFLCITVAASLCTYCVISFSSSDFHLSIIRGKALSVQFLFFFPFMWTLMRDLRILTHQYQFGGEGMS
jgi:hypothetical protein